MAVETLSQPVQNTLIDVGRRERSLVGWTTASVKMHLDHHLHSSKFTPWCNVDCAARTFFNKLSPLTRQLVRHRLRGLQRRMIDDNKFLVVEYAPRSQGTHGEAIRFKVYQQLESEQEHAIAQLQRMRQRRELSEKYLLAAERILRPVTAAG